MGYEIFADHPESVSRRTQDFNSWLFWAEKNAPWSGVSVPDVAALLKVVCPDPDMGAVCAKLDAGGTLTPEEVTQTLQRAAGAMTDTVRRIFETAAANRYPVLVKFSQGAFAGARASAYLENSGSA